MPLFYGLAGPGGGANGGGFSGGGSSLSETLELPGLVEFGEIFADWLRGLSTFWNALNVPIGDLLIFYNSDSAPAFTDFIDKIGLGDLTLLMLILGGSLMFYVVYQLLTWLLNIIT